MKKTTLAATITILLIITAFTTIHLSQRGTQKITIPTNLNESNFLQQLTPRKTAKGFFGIPWGTNSQDVEGLSYDLKVSKGWPDDNIYLKELEPYYHNSLQLEISYAPRNNPKFLFNSKYGLAIGMLDASFSDAQYDNFLDFVKNIETFFYTQYGPHDSRTEDWLNAGILNKKFPIYSTQWHNEKVLILLAYTKPSVTFPFYMCIIQIGSIKQAEKIAAEMGLE